MISSLTKYKILKIIAIIDRSIYKIGLKIL